MWCGGSGRGGRVWVVVVDGDSGMGRGVIAKGGIGRGKLRHVKEQGKFLRLSLVGVLGCTGSAPEIFVRRCWRRPLLFGSLAVVHCSTSSVSVLAFVFFCLRSLVLWRFRSCSLMFLCSDSVIWGFGGSCDFRLSFFIRLSFVCCHLSSVFRCLVPFRVLKACSFFLSRLTFFDHCFTSLAFGVSHAQGLQCPAPAHLSLAGCLLP